MLENNYTVVKDTVAVEGVEYTTYGIRCNDEVIRDISTDCDFVNELARVLNDNNVSDIHFHDVVEDFLN